MGMGKGSMGVGVGDMGKESMRVGVGDMGKESMGMRKGHIGTDYKYGGEDDCWQGVS